MRAISLKKVDVGLGNLLSCRHNGAFQDDGGTKGAGGVSPIGSLEALQRFAL